MKIKKSVITSVLDKYIKSDIICDIDMKSGVNQLISDEYIVKDNEIIFLMKKEKSLICENWKDVAKNVVIESNEQLEINCYNTYNYLSEQRKKVYSKSYEGSMYCTLHKLEQNTVLRIGLPQNYDENINDLRIFLYDTIASEWNESIFNVKYNYTEDIQNKIWSWGGLLRQGDEQGLFRGFNATGQMKCSMVNTNQRFYISLSDSASIINGNMLYTPEFNTETNRIFITLNGALESKNIKIPIIINKDDIVAGKNEGIVMFNDIQIPDNCKKIKLVSITTGKILFEVFNFKSKKWSSIQEYINLEEKSHIVKLRAKMHFGSKINKVLLIEADSIVD